MRANAISQIDYLSKKDKNVLKISKIIFKDITLITTSRAELRCFLQITVLN